MRIRRTPRTAVPGLEAPPVRAAAVPLDWRGHVVGIHERDGQRFVRIAVEPSPILETTTGGLGDAHLGDPVRIGVVLALESVRLDVSVPAAAPRPRRNPSRPRGRTS